MRASIWANPGNGFTFYHVTFQRLYQEDGKMRAANGFRTLDLPVLAYTAGEAYKWLQAREMDEAMERRKAQKKVKTKTKQPAVVDSAADAEGNGDG